MKDIDEDLIPFFFYDHTIVLTGYKFSIDAVDDYQFIANNEAITSKSYVPLAIKRNPIRSNEGTVLNELEIGLDNVGLDFKNDVMSGKFNNKTCKIYQVICYRSGSPSYLYSKGEMLLFQGFMDEPKGDEHWITCTVRPFSIFDREYPKRIYQAGCNWSFGGTGCPQDIDDWDDVGLVNSTLDNNGRTITCSHGKAASYYVPGVVKMTSGANNGAVRPVEDNGTGNIVLRIPFDNPLEAGATFTAIKLCARNYVACNDIFSSYSGYGGYPFVPKEPII
jgi:hypothetical protein